MKTIASRLTFWFLVLSLVPLLGLAAVMYRVGGTTATELVQRSLLAIADGKANELEDYATFRIRDATALGRSFLLIQAADTLGDLDEKKLAEKREMYAPALSEAVDALDFANGYLFDEQGKLLLQARPGLDVGSNLLNGPAKDKDLKGVFERARTLLQTDLSDFEVYPGRAQPRAFVAAPVLKDGAVVGVVALELNNDLVFQVFSNYSGLGRTGEILVGTRDPRNEEEVVVVAPTRKTPDAAFKMRIPMNGPKARPLQYAVTGQRGLGEEFDYLGDPCVACWTYLPSFRWGMVVKQDVAEAYTPITRVRTIMAGVLIATIIGVVTVGLLVARSLSRPIQEAADAAKAVASGDLTTDIHTMSRGEAGQLLTAIQTMTVYLRNLIGKIQVSSVALLSTATEIAATARQQEQTMNDYGASTSQAAAAVQEITATSQELLRTMNEVNDVAGQTADRATSGQAGLSDMDRTMRHLAESTGSINSKLAIISERARNINLVVTTITKVADQTNLLSINAAIEAEKAGEYGLGFLVVAREIRRLADQTAVATLDIERMVKEMQQSVTAGVMEMDKFSEQVRQGVDEVGRLSSQLGEIITAVKTLTTRFDQVTEGMRAQSQGADQIREAMVRLNDGARQTLHSLSEFNTATDRLRDSVSSLKEDVSWFTVTRK